MKKVQITGKELRTLGFPEGPVIRVVMQVVEKMVSHRNKKELLEQLKNVLASPELFREDPEFGEIAQGLIKPDPPLNTVSLNQSGIRFSIFGQEHIEAGALSQMYTAAKLPVAVSGALMPDAHSGYGLPIGGVLATDNAVIPYGVGVDIGCRMCLSVFDIAPAELENRKDFFTRTLDEWTLFGSGAQFQRAGDHDVMEHELFDMLPLLKGLHGRAWKQLGTSGSGNHFVEFGVVEIEEKDDVLKLEPGRYTGLLSHSGSRALGANIANHYTKIARQKRRLPGDASNLAWLGLDEEEGMEYWLAMNLAGDYASACHHLIHEKIARALAEKPLTRVENHHNFAWKEMLDGREVVVHRKGATPAGKDVLGIIPGSMTADGFIVKGKGLSSALSSASHGAGRKMSRTAAIKSITRKEMDKVLKQHGVTLLGGGTDESPFAYKDIHEVMKNQEALVDIVGRFIPKIVKMDGAQHKSWRDKKNSNQVEGE